MSIENGSKVRVHYRGTLEDGTEFDSSYQRDEPLEFVVGSGQVITGFDEAVAGMDVGGQLKVTIPSDNAYGPHHPEGIHEAPWPSVVAMVVTALATLALFVWPDTFYDLMTQVVAR